MAKFVVLTAPDKRRRFVFNVDEIVYVSESVVANLREIHLKNKSNTIAVLDGVDDILRKIRGRELGAVVPKANALKPTLAWDDYSPVSDQILEDIINKRVQKALNDNGGNNSV